MRAGFVQGQGVRLSYCVAVLQHVRDVAAAAKEFARVTLPGGRIVAVEPDNSARYFYTPRHGGAGSAGRRPILCCRGEARGDSTEPAIGPKLPTIFGRHGIEPIDVRLFPVSQTQLGALPDAVWNERRARVDRAIAEVATFDVKTLGREYLVVLEAYHSEAKQAGASFMEIQNTVLFCHGRTAI